MARAKLYTGYNFSLENPSIVGIFLFGPVNGYDNTTNSAVAIAQRTNRTPLGIVRNP